MSWFFEALSRAEKKRAESTNLNGVSRKEIVSTRLVAVGLALAVAVIAFLIGCYWRGARSDLGASAPEVAAAAQPEPRTALQPKLLSPPPPPAEAHPAKDPMLGPGFILQVAAMKDEANANAVLKALREENFPVFVFRVATDHLYRVAVGPFKGRPPGNIRDRLRAKGLEPFSRPWPPSGSSRLPFLK